MSVLTILLVLLAQWAALAAIMAGAWAIQQRTANSGFVDAVWTLGLGALGVVSALVPVQEIVVPTGKAILVAGLMAAWSLRLGLHIVQRSLARPDDPRYAALIQQWGPHAPRQMFLLLQKQAIVTVPLALTVFVAAHNPALLFRVQDWLAIAVLAIGIAGESVADRQLRAWMVRRGETDRICDRGLWRWSRHPNYFFEWVFWLAFPFLAIDLAGGYPFGWLALAGPACVYWLLVHVSGIPPLEQHMLAKHGAAYRAYQARTGAFFPVPSKGAP